MTTPTEPSSTDNDILEPPTKITQIVRHLGPGVIIAGSIVGSGELVATTLAGAQAGFTLLWLIIIGCVIKVFVQVEFARHAMIWGKTTMKALDDVPGPRLRANWILWFWLVMTCLVVVQQGGILGAIGEALSLIFPLTADGQAYNAAMSEKIRAVIAAASDPTNTAASEAATKPSPASPYDVKYWAIGISLITAVLLFFGRFMLIQWVSTVLVFGFTIMTIINLAMLQFDPKWAITGSDLLHGLSFSLPESISGISPLAAAMAAFGIIGVGAAELIQYPYFCLEKGYAKHTGPNDNTPAWRKRAKGWVRILRIDAWTSMVVYTFCTIAFYVMGAAVLGRIGLMPEGSTLVRTLGEMYEPVFGDWAQIIFVSGAIAVLYSTFFIAAAGMARLVADGLGLFGLLPNDEKSRLYWTRVISCVWPLMALAMFLFVNAPIAMILASGIAQAIMLPILGVAALYFRYRGIHDEELRPGRLWDICLLISVVGMFAVGIWTIFEKLGPVFSS